MLVSPTVTLPKPCTLQSQFMVLLKNTLPAFLRFYTGHFILTLTLG